MTERLDSKKVLDFAAKKKSFTTEDVADRFDVSPRQAAAGISILRIKEVVEPDKKRPNDTSSRWKYVG